VIFIGRPETNSALAAWSERLGLDYGGADFRISGEDHASEKEAISFAATNPLDPKRMVLVLAGNSALETVRLAGAGPVRAQYAIYQGGKMTSSGFLR